MEVLRRGSAFSVLDLGLHCGLEAEVSGTCTNRVRRVRVCLQPGLHVAVGEDVEEPRLGWAGPSAGRGLGWQARGYPGLGACEAAVLQLPILGLSFLIYTMRIIGGPSSQGLVPLKLCPA